MFQSFNSRPARRLMILLKLSCLALLIAPPGAFAATQAKPTSPEDVAEIVIAVYGSRNALAQIRRNGVERGKLTRNGAEGRTEEISYERRFIRGDESVKDRVRLDQKASAAEYALIYGDGNLWGVVSGSVFTPRDDAKADFFSNLWYDIDALLRYKENKSTLTLVGKDKQKNIDLWVIDLVDAEKRRVRYYVSSTTYRVLWLEYEQPGAGEEAAKYKKTFHDYRIAQGTLVPFRSVLYLNGNQVSERRVLTVTYGVKMDESLFKNSETTSTAQKG